MDVRSVGGGGTTNDGTGASPRVAFWTAVNTIGGDADFTYANDTLTLSGAGAGGMVGQLTINPSSGFAAICLKQAAASGKFNWLIAMDRVSNNNFEIIPSTAADGTTFTTPAIAINGTSSTVTIGALASTATHQFQGQEVKFITAVATTNVLLYRSVDTGGLLLCGGNAASTGANMQLYGSTHATLGGDFLLRTSSTAIVNYDHSALLLTLAQTNVVTYVMGNHRVGVATVQTFTTEQCTNYFTQDGDANSHVVMNNVADLNGNTAFSVAGLGVNGTNTTIKRTITSNTTDTAVRFAGYFAQFTFVISGGTTLTNAQTHGWSAFTHAPSAAFAGTLALTHYAAFYCQANSTASGTNKYGLRVGDLSGASNNYAIHTGTGIVRLGDYLLLEANADPGAITNGVSITGLDLASTNRSFNFRTEEAVAVIGGSTVTHKIPVTWNGTEYKILLSNN